MIGIATAAAFPCGRGRTAGGVGMAIFRGTKKRDVIKGTARSDTISGLDADDRLNGAGGNDTIKGGKGNDKLLGGTGNDKIYGEAGNDSLKGESGNDLLTGGTGTDSIIGGSGTDTAVFATTWANAAITTTSGGFQIAGGAADGADTVSQVELFKFANGTFAAAQILNDAPVAAADAGLTTNEDTPLTLTPGQLLANDTDADATLGDVLALVSVQNPVNGTVALVGGEVVFTPAPGFNGSASFTYTVRDLKGGTSTAVATIAVTAVNDPASISGAAQGYVIDGLIASDTGTLTVLDADIGESELHPVPAGTPGLDGYGTFEVAPSGVWIYTLNQAHAAVRALGPGAELTDRLTVTSKDGTVSQIITITITGSNDGAQITGTSAGAITEDAAPNSVTGNLDLTDVDNPADTFQAVTAPASTTYGTYTVTADGVWTYTLDNGNVTVDALNVGEHLTDTFTVLAQDGTAQLVTITIQGANDAAVITGAASGAITEDAAPNTVTGSLHLTDVDNPSDTFQAVSTPTASALGYGTYTVTAAGLWTYSLNNANTVVNALNTSSPPLTDSFTVIAQDGTPQTVTVTINGHNDVAIIFGDIAGLVDEDAASTIATGDLQSTDPDDPSSLFLAVAAPTLSESGYGTYTVTVAGGWTYTLDNSHPAIEVLGDSDELTDTFTVFSVDGTPQVVTVTITGTTDATLITGTTDGSVDEDAPNNTATGDLYGTISGTPADSFQVVSTPQPSTNGYGSFTITAAGVWIFALNNENPTINALRDTDSVSDSFIVHAADGMAQLITVTITGTNDGAVISGTATGNVTEDGTPTATGTLTVSDIDTGEAELQPVAAGTSGTNGYGTFAVTAAGVWTYTLNNGHASVQALPAGVTLTDSITVSSEDGTASQLITVTITGTNDGAVISGTATGNVTEDGTPTATGTLTVSDIDTGEAELQPVAAGTPGTNGYGTFAVTAAGVDLHAEQWPCISARAW
ncbi:MAG: VCBS domain-containing protein [Hyphomicrobiaceae bacterium]